MGVVLRSSLRNEKVKSGYRYNFRGLKAQFLKNYVVEKNPKIRSYLKLWRVLKFPKWKKPKSTFGPTLTCVEKLAYDDNVTSHMFGIKYITMMYGGRRPTKADLKNLERDYPLSKHDWIPCLIRLDFQEPLDDDLLIDEDNRRVDFDIDLESKSEYNDEYEEGDYVLRKCFHPSFAYCYILFVQRTVPPSF